MLTPVSSHHRLGCVRCTDSESTGCTSLLAPARLCIPSPLMCFSMSGLGWHHSCVCGVLCRLTAKETVAGEVMVAFGCVHPGVGAPYEHTVNQHVNMF